MTFLNGYGEKKKERKENRKPQLATLICGDILFHGGRATTFLSSQYSICHLTQNNTKNKNSHVFKGNGKHVQVRSRDNGGHLMTF